MSLNIFISYSSYDKLLADKLFAELQLGGFMVWRDIVSIPRGSYWTDEIDKGLLAADVVLGCVTPQSLVSRRVRDEWVWALRHGKRLVFVAWEGIQWMSPEFAEIPVINFTSAYHIVRSVKPEYIVKLTSDEMQESAAFDQLKALLNGEDVAAHKYVYETQRFYDPAIIEEFRGKHPVFPEDWPERMRLWQKVLGFVAEFDDQVTYQINTPYSVNGVPRSMGEPLLQTITRIFHEARGRLVINGVLGSGKTTAVHTLVRELLFDARDNPKNPIPVWAPMFSLNIGLAESGGVEDSVLFADALHRIYEIDLSVAESWLNQGAVCMIIDQADEFGLDTHVQHTSNALTHWMQQQPECQFVLVTHASKSLPADKLGSHTIDFLPLSDGMIEDYIREFESLDGLRAAMRRESALLNSVRTMFVLRMMSNAYSNIPHSDIVKGVDRSAYENETIDRYVKAQLKQHLPSKYPVEQAIRWLSYLTASMDYQLLKGLPGSIGDAKWLASFYVFTPAERRQLIVKAGMIAIIGGTLITAILMFLYDTLAGFQSFGQIWIPFAVLGMVGGCVGAIICLLIYHGAIQMLDEQRKQWKPIEPTSEHKPEGLAAILVNGIQGAFKNIEGDHETAYGQQSIQAEAARNAWGFNNFVFGNRNPYDAYRSMWRWKRDITDRSLITGAAIGSGLLPLFYYLQSVNAQLVPSLIRGALLGLIVWVLLEIETRIRRFLKRNTPKATKASSGRWTLFEIFVFMFVGMAGAWILNNLINLPGFGILGGATAMMLLWLERRRERNRKSQREKIADQTLDRMTGCLSFIQNLLLGVILSIPGILLPKFAERVGKIRVNRQVKMSFVRVPKSGDFITIMESCGFVKSLGGTDFFIFVHPILHHYFRDHQ